MSCSVDIYRAAIGLFIGTLQKILRRKAVIAANRIRGLRVRNVSSFITLATLLVLLFIGGVESNPGPRQQKGSDTSLLKDNPSDDDNFRRLHETLANVSSTMARMETTQNSFSTTQENLSSQVSDIKTKLDIKLAEIEHKQEEHDERISELSDECDRLQEENDNLRSKLDYLDNQGRRNNLLFHGIPEKKNETWDDCERTLYDIIYGEMGVRANVMIERAHRVGTAIIAKFLSYKDKVNVLSRAKYLRGTDIYVREDVSEMVREKQKSLVPLMKELREKHERAKIQHDKLITSVGTFTYDMATKSVVKLEKSKRQPNSNTQHELRHTRKRSTEVTDRTSDRHGRHSLSPSAARDPTLELDSHISPELEQERQPHPSTPPTSSRPSKRVPTTALYSEAAKTRQRIPSPTPSPSRRRDSMNNSTSLSSGARPKTTAAGKRTSTMHESSSAAVSVLVNEKNSVKNITNNGRPMNKDGKRQGRLDHMLAASQSR